MEAVLVTLTSKTAEIRGLASTAGYKIRKEILQNRARADPASFVGKGKISEVKESVEASEATHVIFNGILKAPQLYNLEQTLGVACIDRLGIILEIFGSKARTPESKLQVEIAKMEYQLPLLREWIHRAKLGERPGFMAGGEYHVDVYYEQLKGRMRRTREKLKEIQGSRESRRQRRREKGFCLVALAGYTFAGKTTLLNALTKEHLTVDGLLFSTLSPATRALSDPSSQKILLTDTVGLIDDVPIWLVDAFQSTLEEVLLADLVLLVIDAAEETTEGTRKIAVAKRFLFPKLKESAVLPVLAKGEVASGAQIEAVQHSLREEGFSQEPVVVSAQTGLGLATLVERITQMAGPVSTVTVTLRGSRREAVLSQIYDLGDVLEVRRGKDLHVKVSVPTRNLPAIARLGDIRRASPITP